MKVKQAAMQLPISLALHFFFSLNFVSVAGVENKCGMVNGEESN